MGSFFIEKVFKSPVETVPDQVAMSSEICVSPLQDYPKRKRGLRVVPSIPGILTEKFVILVPKPGLEPGRILSTTPSR
jgi:hypothetical protein